VKISFELSPSFKRAFKKRIGNNEILRKKFDERFSIFLNDPFDSRLKTHKLTGELEGLHSFTINYDLRVIFYFSDENTATLTDIGTHDQVY
jgi:mRNA-degrading endonuclease YafQ of YafQ-DinJ toxin-antitoxin module